MGRGIPDGGGGDRWTKKAWSRGSGGRTDQWDDRQMGHLMEKVNLWQLKGDTETRWSCGRDRWMRSNGGDRDDRPKWKTDGNFIVEWGWVWATQWRENRRTPCWWWGLGFPFSLFLRAGHPWIQKHPRGSVGIWEVGGRNLMTWEDIKPQGQLGPLCLPLPQPLPGWPRRWRLSLDGKGRREREEWGGGGGGRKQRFERKGK